MSEIVPLWLKLAYAIAVPIIEAVYWREYDLRTCSCSEIWRRQRGANTDFEATVWFGLMAPAGTPQPIIDKLHQETAKFMAIPEIRKRLEGLGLQLVGNSPAAFAAVVKNEIPQWAKVIKGARIKPPSE